MMSSKAYLCILTALSLRLQSCLSFSPSSTTVPRMTRPAFFFQNNNNHNNKPSQQQQQQHNNKPYASSSTTSLSLVIKGDRDEETSDTTRGGVGLAQESAIKIIGTGTEPEELLRYTQVTSMVDSAFKDVNVLCKGTGKELMEESGSEANIVQSPSDAVRNALSSDDAMDSSSSSGESIVLNFLGGDDLKFSEVLDAVQLMVEGLEMTNNDNKVTFNSLCHESFPNGVCTVTVVSVDGGAGGNAKEDAGVEGSLKKGELYFHSGKWHTVLKENMIEDAE